MLRWHGAGIASLTVRVSVDTSKIEYISGPSNSNFRNGRIIYTWTDPNGGETPITGGNIATFKLRAVSPGTASFSVSGDFFTPDETAANLSFSGTSIIIEQPETPRPTVAPEETSTIGTPTITQTQEPTATPDNVNIQGTPLAEPTTSNNNEPVILPTTIEQSNEQNQQVPIVTENNAIGQQKQVENLSSNSNLKSLRLDIGELLPGFQKDITTYGVYVEENVINVDVLAVPEDNKSDISIKGNNNLQQGNNVVLVTVTAEDGTQKIYTINVTKSNMASKINSKLENLAIENVMLSPDFNPNVFNYTAEVGSNVNNINVLAIPQIENATVSINGANDLNYGENEVVITVTSENEQNTDKYYIKVYKKTETEEQTVNEKKETVSDIYNQAKKEKEAQDTKQYGSILFAIILSISLIVTIAIITKPYWKKIKRKK